MVTMNEGIKPILEIDNIPKELKMLKNWVLWKLVDKKDGKKPTKIPYQINGLPAESDNRNTWASFDDAISILHFQPFIYNGIGFMFEFPYVGFDTDNSIDEETGEIDPTAWGMIAALKSYTELSPSKKGFHIIVKVTEALPENRYKKKGDYECYEKERFFTFTGNVYQGLSEIHTRDEEVNRVIQKVFLKPVASKVTYNHSLVGSPFASTHDLWEKMFNSNKKGTQIQRLYRGDYSDYPSRSEARLGLLNDLAFYTRCDEVQMDAAIRETGFIEKWDDKRGNTTLGSLEIKKAIESCQDVYDPSYGKNDKDFQLFVKEDAEPITSQMIPKPFVVKGKSLFIEVEEGTGENKVTVEKLVSRYVPFITKKFEHIERGEVHYEIAWEVNERVYKEVVPASTLAVKRKLVDQLSVKGLSVTDLNGNLFLKYFDLYQVNNEIECFRMVERLGMVADEFVHPIISEDISIIPSDFGYKRIVKAFEEKGDMESWKVNVLDRIKDNPKALFMVLASFTSIILQDLKLEPMIVDLTGSTSRGKSRVLAAAASVWGDGRGLISEFNATLNSIERKAAFLGNYPSFYDDHNKAPRQVLEKLIYNYSGGLSKGRATIQGIQEEFTWNNLLICNGENSILDYVERAGGAAARVISLADFSFDNKDDDFFIKLSSGIDENCGVAGIEFLKMWQTKKEQLLPSYHDLRNLFIRESKSNDVLSRLSKHYSAVVFVGDVLNKLFDFNINCTSLVELFREMQIVNDSLDKPKQLLNEVLQDLDSDRESIYYDFPPKERKAVFHGNQLYLLPKYLKEFLGVEMKQVRKEWARKEFTYKLENKKMAEDVKQLKHKGETMQVVPINPEIIEELGYDFQQEQYK